MSMIGSILNLPNDLVRFVADDAARDANRVAIFLDVLGLQACPSKPITLPAGFLLDLGAALRLLLWERNGLRVHRDAGLPSAHEAIVSTFKGITNPNSCAWGELSLRVLVLSVEHFAWSARFELEADILLDTPEEEAALDAMAQFLWDHRHLRHESQGS